MAQLLMLTSTVSGDVLPALSFLSHRVRRMPAEAAALVDAPRCDAVLLDARGDLHAARALSRILTATGLDAPLILVVGEGGFPAVGVEWGADDVILASAGAAEVDARLRLAIGRRTADHLRRSVSASGIVIDEDSYSARVRGRALDLTFKEFELLRFLVAHPGRVFTREQLLSDVWGYDYFGGTRTVDVHVRRLRAKLGDMESVIGTVRNVGYRFNLYEEDEEHEPVDSGVPS